MKIKSLLGMGLILGLSGIMYGCGDDAKPAATGPEGTVLQGPVSGATVVAKKVGNTDFSKVETGEDSTSTDSTGKFKFQSAPTYAYTLVTLPNGKDTLTNKTNIPLVAKAGSTYVTPLTTLVATDTTGTVEAKLLALAGGTAASIGDVNISTTTPAALVVAKAVETAASAVAETVTKAAGTASISSVQLAAVQTQTLKEIAAEMATTALNLSKPADLTTVLNTSIATAIPKITASNTNIVITAGNIGTVATAIADVAVDQSAKAILGAASGKADVNVASTATTVVESEKINTTTAAAIATATTTAATTASAATTVTATPTTYTPPVLPTALAPALVSATLSVSSSGIGTMTIKFNHKIDKESGSGGVFIGTTEIEGTDTINEAGDTITFVTSTSLPGAAKLTVSLSSFLPVLSSEEAGKHFAARMPAKSFEFTVPGTSGSSGSAGSSSLNF